MQGLLWTKCSPQALPLLWTACHTKIHRGKARVLGPLCTPRLLAQTRKLGQQSIMSSEAWLPIEHHWLINASAPTEGSGGEGRSDEGVLGPPGKRTHTTADGVGSQPLPRSETKKTHKYRTFNQGISETTTKTMPLLILQPTMFGNFQRKRPSPPQGSRGSKIPVSSAPV